MINDVITFLSNEKISQIDFKFHRELSPTTTVLNYLRKFLNHKGTKEGCGEGDCGACTVVLGELVDGKISYKAVNSCLIFLPMLHGKHLITVEKLKNPDGKLHPVQQAMIDEYGSQCGFCTPGIVMSMFALYKNYNNPTREQIDDALTGNLCRCTGYRPIVDAAEKSCKQNCIDHFTYDEAKIVDLLKSISKESVHIQTKKQKYFRPASLGEAITLKHQHPDAIVVSGATDVAIRVTKGHELLEKVIDLSGIDELKEISETDSSIMLGACATINEVIPKIKANFPALHEMLSAFASNQIRNFATLGGNLGTASPVGDSIPVLIAYGAKVILESLNGKREVNINDYITGYRKTVRKPDELITSIVIPKLTNNSVVKSYKISKRRDVDISTLSAGFKLELDNGIVSSVILAYGGMAEVPKLAVNTERFLIGKNWNRETIGQAMKFVDQDYSPISDTRSSAEYRKVVAKNLLLKFWNEINHG